MFSQVSVNFLTGPRDFATLYGINFADSSLRNFADSRFRILFLRIRDSVILRICVSAISSFAYPQFCKFFALRPAEKLNPPIKPLPYSPNHPYINYLFFYKRRYTFIHICMEKIKLSAKKSFSLADPQNSHLHIRNILICISAIFQIFLSAPSGKAKSPY